jgi:hypothetical protein
VLEADGFAHGRRLVAPEKRRRAVGDERTHVPELVVVERQRVGTQRSRDRP